MSLTLLIHRLLCAEYLPWVIKRWEYIECPKKPGTYNWNYIGWPPNKGERRDIPATALFHRSVIDRMDLSPDPNPEKYRTELYRPNNSLWVHDSSAQLTKGVSKATSAPSEADNPNVVESNLRKLADQKSPKDQDYNCETEGLLKPDIKFVFDKDLTKGSVAVEGENIVVGPTEWDGIYSVATDS